MVQLFVSKQLFLLKLANCISVEERKKRSRLLELKQLEEISVTGKGFVCLFYAHNFSPHFAIHAPDGFIFPILYFPHTHFHCKDFAHGSRMYMLLISRQDIPLCPNSYWHGRSFFFFFFILMGLK